MSLSASLISNFYACDYPKNLAAPTKVGVTQSSISIAWTQPSDNGGCSITGYAIFIGIDDSTIDQNTGDITYQEVHADAVRNKPNLN